MNEEKSEIILSRWQDPTIKQLQQENQSLKDKIEKAIEHIGQELLVYDNESDEYDVGIKLLEILKGDKE